MTKKSKKTKSNLHSIDPATMAKTGHLSDNKPFMLNRAKDEPGRVEDIMRKRSRVYKKVAATAPVLLDWKSPPKR